MPLTYEADREDIAQEYQLELALARVEGRTPRPRRWVEADYWRAQLGRGGARVLDHCDCDAAESDEGGPFEAVLRAELARAVVAALATLPPRHREVMAAYYWGDELMRETGVRLGVTEARVCQIHAASIKRLRVAMGEG